MHSIVSVKRCSSYLREEVQNAVNRCVELLGGTGSFVEPGDRVLIKPNLLSAREPGECITTHPEVVRAVIRLVKAAGGEPAVGDSHGGSQHRMEKVYEKTGVRDVCSEEQTECLVFEKFKKVNGIPVAVEALQRNKLISLPKFKTHSLTIITAGIKNVFGTVPGLYKTHCHMQHPNPHAFSRFLARLYGTVKPHLNVLDAVGSLEGEGPGAAGTPRRTNFIAASPDAVSLDAALCGFIGLDPKKVLSVTEAGLLGFGEGRPENILIKGEPPRASDVEDFQLPRPTFLHKTPDAFLRPLAGLLKLVPDASREKCTGCGVCAESCPAKACRIYKNRVVFERSKCILCLCCLEFCPAGAVYIRKNLLSRLLHR